jgi:hypothetical protein
MILNWCHREPTLEDILSDSITKAVMEADGVDPQQNEHITSAHCPRKMANRRAFLWISEKFGVLRFADMQRG